MLTALALSVVVAASPDAGVDSPVLDLARAWEAARLFHPSAIHGGVDLDAAFIAALPAAEAATTVEARTAAVQQLLAALKDPAARVGPASEAPVVRDTPAFEARKGYAVFDARSSRVEELAAFFSREPLSRVLGPQAHVVVDLRGVGPDDPVGWLRVPEVLPPFEVQLPRRSTVVHRGYGERAGGHYGSSVETSVPPVQPGDARSKNRRWAFVIEPGDTLPEWALALREAGIALLVSTSELGDDVYAGVTRFELGAGLALHLPTTELVGGHVLRTDVRVPSGKDPIEVAGAALAAGKRPRQGAPRGTAAVRPFTLADTTEAFPDAGRRVLAGVRLWVVARRFWAYPHLHRQDADAVLLAAIPSLQQAATAARLREVLDTLAAQLMPDAHVRVLTATDDAERAPAPIVLAEVEGKFVVRVAGADALQAGVEQWDVVVAVDGVATVDKVATLLPRIAAPTEAGRSLELSRRLALCPEGATLPVTLEKGSGRRKDVALTCSTKNWGLYGASGPAPHYRVLPGNIGFVDLVALTAGEVTPMLEALKATRAIIFDDRGYPKGTGFDIGPRLGAAEPGGVAQMCLPIVRAEGTGGRVCEAFVQQLPRFAGAHYTRPTVMLIDEQAMSHAEHTALIFEAYARTTFVGSPSVGANGNVGTMSLPGRLRVLYTGLEVRHLDGRQLQDVGIVPQVRVKPTLAGLRAGRDEVLEKAIEVIDTKLAPVKKK